MKKAISVLLALALLFAFAGCVDKDGSKASTTTQATTTIPTSTTPTTVPTTPGNETLYQPEDIPQVFWNVLNNKQAFKLFDSVEETFADTNLDEYRFPSLDDAIAESEVGYCVVDMDGDGKDELVLNVLDTLILREVDGVIYGYAFSFDWMGCVCDDGTFDFMDEYEIGTGKLCFDENGTYSVTELVKVIVNDEFEPVECYIAGETVDEDTYWAYIMENEAEPAEYNLLDRYPLADNVSPDMGG